MPGIFSGSEIVELGVQIEVNGRDFYHTLVGKSHSAKAKKVFKLLEGEEEKHIADFQKVLDSVQKYEPKEAYPTEYFSYMNSLAGEYVFTKHGKGVEIAEGAKNEKEAVELGIGFERDSIKFYEGMRKIVPSRSGQIIDKLIEEEKEHVNKLTELKEMSKWPKK